jgi:FkbM family methyltransferase
MLDQLRHSAVVALKRAAYGRRGEPYPVRGHVLRFTPGSRPIWPRYANSPNAVNRYDALQNQLLVAGLREGDTAIDVGGHAGQEALIMAACCGLSGQVVTFEPDPHAVAMLERNLDLNPAIKRPKVERAAVSDTAGEAVLFSKGGNANSSLAASGLGKTDAEEIRVPTIVLDDYLAAHGLAPAWVKIDTEGAEIRILKGAARLLAGPAQIICELHPYAWPEFGDTFGELAALVAASGRRMRYLDQDHELRGEPTYGSVLLERLETLN